LIDLRPNTVVCIFSLPGIFLTVIEGKAEGGHASRERERSLCVCVCAYGEREDEREKEKERERERE
jgi:hypothetical protein